MKALIIEDDPSITRLCQGILSTMGYEVESVDNTLIASEFLGSKNYDIVVSDIHMDIIDGVQMEDVMDGIELMVEVHKTKPDLPFLMMTGHDGEDIYEKIVSAGAADYLPKPFSSGRFRTTINRIKKDQDLLRLAQDKTREAEKTSKRLEQIVENINPLVIMDRKDDRCMFTECNTPFLKLIGGSQEDVLRSYCIYSERPGVCDKCPSEVVTQTGAPAQNYAVLRGRKFLISASPLLNLEGDIEGIIANFNDVTELAMMEEKYTELFESSLEARYVTDPSGNIKISNLAFRELFGYSEDEILGMNAGDTYANPEERARFKAEMEKNGSVTGYKVTLVSKEGREINCEITAVLNRNYCTVINICK